MMAQMARLGQAVQQPAIQLQAPAGTAAAAAGVASAASDETAAGGVAGTSAAGEVAGTAAAEGLAGTAAAAEGLAGTAAADAAAEGLASSFWTVGPSYPTTAGKQTTAIVARGRHPEWHSPCTACRKRSCDRLAQSGGRPQSVQKESSGRQSQPAPSSSQPGAAAQCPGEWSSIGP